MTVADIPFVTAALQRYAPFIIGFIVLLVVFELMRIPGRLKAKAAFSRLSGRAMGTVTDYRKERYLRNESHDPETGDSYEYVTIIRYQFEVNGRIYTGEGEGNGAFWQKGKQMICYDPDDPEENCTLFYMNSKTKSHFLKTVLFFIGLLIMCFIVIVVMEKLKK